MNKTEQKNLLLKTQQSKFSGLKKKKKKKNEWKKCF